MIRRYRAGAVVAVCALVTVAGVVGARAATRTGSSPAPGQPGRWMVCAGGAPVRAGHLDSVTIGPSDPDGRPGVYRLQATGTIMPCPGGAPGTVFALGTYYPTRAYTPSGALRRYPSAGGPFTFTIGVRAGAEAVCLITNPDTRLGCYGLSWPTPGAAPVVTGRADVNTPAVVPPVKMTIMQIPEPSCITCWP